MEKTPCVQEAERKSKGNELVLAKDELLGAGSQDKSEFVIW